MKENKTEKSLNKIKQKKSSRLIEALKRRWLIDGTKTLLLVAIIIVMFITVNIFMQKMELTPIDLSQDKINSLTKESKEKVKDINKEVKIYFVGYDNEDSNLELAKQYKKANENIIAEAVDINNRPDLSQKYGIDKDAKGIIVECGEKSKVLTENDLVTYDMNTYETISIAEEKLTSSIMSVISDKIPIIYFLDGYSDSFSLQQNMNYLNAFFENEVSEVKTLNILTTGNVPEDCDTLVITTPSKDFDSIATDAIINYINSGKNILWFNAAQTQSKNLTNVNKVLSLYSVNPFDTGVIRETNPDNMLRNSTDIIPDIIIPKTQYSNILKDVNNSAGAVLINPTKININEDKLEEQKVEKQELLKTTEGAYFRTNFQNSSNEKADDEESKEFIVGAELKKTIKEADEENNQKEIASKLIIYGENIFISDSLIGSTPAISYGSNRDVVLNSIAYLVDRPEDITARKSTGTVVYTATAAQDRNIRIIIFAVPIVIIIIGIIVWQVRRRKK